MSLQITGIEDAGNIDKERLILKASADVDIGYYAIFQAWNVDATSVGSGNVPHVYWFMNKKVKAGDFVVLYTKSGQRSEKSSPSNVTSHFFYWGHGTPMWDDRVVACCVETPNWRTFRLPQPTASAQSSR